MKGNVLSDDGGMEATGMKDGELRGVVLKRFYEVRNHPPGLVNPVTLPGLDSIDHVWLFNICEQLHEYGLLQWTLVGSTTTVGGMGHISARGVDVVEGTTSSPITVILQDHSISVAGSSNVQIGDSNVQHVNISTPDLSRLVSEVTGHLDELNLDARQKQRAEAQIAALRAELNAGEKPDGGIVRQAGRTLRNITEGSIGSLLAAGASNPTVWQWVHHMLQSF